ncbi:MAG: helix-turn-helix domain-containing protein [Nocardiaceae bacterium]|nr:helix-turn-helix domain-containing protein [Nocardiaceae bacterium]
MTSDLPQLSRNARLLVAFQKDVPKLAMELLEEAVASMPEADTLPPDHFVDEVIPGAIVGIAAALDAIEERRRLSRAEFAQIVEPVVERHMQDGIPPQTLLRALGAALGHMWTLIREESAADDLDDLGAMGSELIYYFTEASCIISEIYSDVEGSFESAARSARRALCAALVRGSGVAQEAARTGIPLANEYLLVALHVGTRPSAARLGDALVARKRMRLVQRHFDQANRALTLSDFDGARGVILIPLVDGASEADQRHLAGDLVDELSEYVDGLYGASLAVTVDKIPDVAAECAEVANLAQIVGRPPGLYTIDDVMLEYQLSRPGPARDRLAKQAEPLLEQTHLLEALEVHLRHGGDRKSAAAELFVHPNTLTYRLRRIGDVTGINPMTPDGSRLLAAALMVHRLEGTQRGA